MRNHPEVVPQIAERLENYISSHKNMEDFSGRLLLVEKKVNLDC